MTRRRRRPGELDELVINLVRFAESGASMPGVEIAEEMRKQQKTAYETTWKVLRRLVESGQLKRYGKRGSYSYTLPNATSPSTATSTSAVDRVAKAVVARRGVEKAKVLELLTVTNEIGYLEGQIADRRKRQAALLAALGLD